MIVYIHRWALLIGLLLGNIYIALAQSVSTSAPEQRIYEFFVANLGDSIYNSLSPDAQKKVSLMMCRDLLPQVERQFGKLQSAGEWLTDSLPGMVIKSRDLTFERYRLRLQFSFGTQGMLEGLWMKPVPEPSTAQPVTYNKDKMEERDITIETDGFKLPGTLTLPKADVAAGKCKVPCVILVHGSGPNDRDETIGPNKPFRDLAYGLAERGIAVIRYDKRTKVYGAACVPVGREMDFDVEVVDDALSAVKLAKTLPEIAPDSVFVLGHSLGGLLAPRIAQRSPGLAGIILLAGPARPLADLMVEQITYLTSLPGTPADAAAKVEDIKKQYANMQRLGTDAFDASIPLPPGFPKSYALFELNYKPVEVAAGLKLPILVLQGERDYQVTMQDFGLWRSGLLRSKNAVFKSYPKLNHLLQEGSGKATPAEYQHASPVPAYVMDDIASFVRGKQILP